MGYQRITWSCVMVCACTDFSRFLVSLIGPNGTYLHIRLVTLPANFPIEYRVLQLLAAVNVCATFTDVTCELTNFLANITYSEWEFNITPLTLSMPTKFHVVNLWIMGSELINVRKYRRYSPQILRAVCTQKTHSFKVVFHAQSNNDTHSTAMKQCIYSLLSTKVASGSERVKVRAWPLPTL